MKWIIKNQINAKSKSGRLNQIRRLLLDYHQVFSPDQEPAFFQSQPISLTKVVNSLSDLNHNNLKKAVDLINQAINSRQPILIYGDYDCDGVSASAILWHALSPIYPLILPFIPHRQKHGYGLSIIGIKEALQNIKEKFPTSQKPLVITVDNGISALEAAEYLSSLSIPLIITDHHHPPQKLPPASAIIHSTKLSGSGVAWILASHFSSKPSLLEFVALGTVCDLIPLTDINRTLVKQGLKSIEQTTNSGLKALKKISFIKDSEPISTYHLGFVIGPRINASGRLGHAIDALRLLCTPNYHQAEILAQKINSLNQDRQDLTSEYVNIAISQIEAQPQIANIIFISNPNYHEGVIGLIASRLADHFYRPTIVGSINEDHLKASVRSIPGIHITKFLSQFEDLFISYGGHDQAAGFSISMDNLDKLQSLIQEKAQFNPEIFEKSLEIDFLIDLEDITTELIQLIKEFEPFGVGNPKPTFAIKTDISSAQIIGKNQDHLKIHLPQPFSDLNIIGFNLASLLPHNHDHPHYLAFSLGENIFQGRSSIQLSLKDISQGI